MKHLLVDFDGSLYVLALMALETEPVVRALWYPTGVRTSRAVSNYGHEILNQPLQQLRGQHGYECIDQRWKGVKIILMDGGRTTPARFEDVPAPPPAPSRVRGKPLRWEYGEWLRILKTGPERLGVDFRKVFEYLGYA
jgi:hypothetical protein